MAHFPLRTDRNRLCIRMQSDKETINSLVQIENKKNNVNSHWDTGCTRTVVARCSPQSALFFLNIFWTKIGQKYFFPTAMGVIQYIQIHY